MVLKVIRRKRILMIITRLGRKYIFLIGIALTLTILINSVILAQYVDNPLKYRNIIIDPGHGGIDGGTNDNVSFFEKEINLQIAFKLKTLLESNKASVRMTRESDISLDDEKSSDMSRHESDLITRVSQFNSGKYDIFISIHVNRSLNSKAIGPIVFFSPKVKQSHPLAECIQESLNKHSKSYLKIKSFHLPVKSSLYILKNANIPGVIVETGFISNVIEKQLLVDEEYQMKLAESINIGILNYFKKLNSRDNAINENIGMPNDEENVPINITDDISVLSE